MVHCDHVSIWHRYGDNGRLKFFQEDSFRKVGRSVGPQYYTDFIYSSSLRQERSARGVRNIGLVCIRHR